MKIIKVIVDELPQEGCLYCQFREIRQKGRSYLHECAVADGFLDKDNLHIRPNWCPLISISRLMKLWEYAETGNWEYKKESEEKCTQ